MANIGEMIAVQEAKFGADLVSWKQVTVLPGFSEVEYYLVDRNTGKPTTVSKKYAIKADGTAVELK